MPHRSSSLCPIIPFYLIFINKCLITVLHPMITFDYFVYPIINVTYLVHPNMTSLFDIFFYNFTYFSLFGISNKSLIWYSINISCIVYVGLPSLVNIVNVEHFNLKCPFENSGSLSFIWNVVPPAHVSLMDEYAHRQLSTLNPCIVRLHI
jgi:hypothetical protein